MRRPLSAQALSAWVAGHALSALLERPTLQPDESRWLLGGMAEHGLLSDPIANRFLDLVRVRGSLADLAAGRRSAFTGWLTLKTEPVPPERIDQVAEQVALASPDVLALVDIEGRAELRRFHEQVLSPMLRAQDLAPYPHEMAFEGKDRLGRRNVGVLSRHPIRQVGLPRLAPAPLELAEYHLDVDGQPLVVVPALFSQPELDPRGQHRKDEAAVLARSYAALREQHPRVAVCGTLYDPPAGGCLYPLLDTDLEDAMTLPAYRDALPGTAGEGLERDKLDYLFLSPALATAVTDVGVQRAAQHHHLVWADLAL